MFFQFWNASRRIAFFTGIFLAVSTTTDVVADEVLSVYFQPVTEGEFPTEHWYPEQRGSIENQLPAMQALLAELSVLDLPVQEMIQTAHKNRAAVVRDLGTNEKFQAAISSLCDEHMAIIEKLKAIQWSDPSSDSISFPFDSESQRYQLQSLSYLAHLAVIREFAEGRTESASHILASALALSHNLQITSGEINEILGVVMQQLLMSAFADLQSMGAPRMQVALERLRLSQLSTETRDRIFWQSVSGSVPLLVDRPRKPEDWKNDLSKTLTGLGNSRLTALVNEDEAEQIGRSLQSIVKRGKQARQLQHPIEFAHGGDPRIEAIPLEQGVTAKVNPIVVPIAKFIEKMLNPEIRNQALDRAQQIRDGTICLEMLRCESAKRGTWVTEITEELRQQFPISPSTGDRPTAVVSTSVNRLPVYEIQMPMLTNNSRRWQNAPNVIVANAEAPFPSSKPVEIP